MKTNKAGFTMIWALLVLIIGSIIALAAYEYYKSAMIITNMELQDMQDRTIAESGIYFGKAMIDVTGEPARHTDTDPLDREHSAGILAPQSPDADPTNYYYSFAAPFLTATGVFENCALVWIRSDPDPNIFTITSKTLDMDNWRAIPPRPPKVKAAQVKATYKVGVGIISWQ